MNSVVATTRRADLNLSVDAAGVKLEQVSCIFKIGIFVDEDLLLNARDFRYDDLKFAFAL